MQSLVFCTLCVLTSVFLCTLSLRTFLRAPFTLLSIFSSVFPFLLCILLRLLSFSGDLFHFNIFFQILHFLNVHFIIYITFSLCVSFMTYCVLVITASCKWLLWNNWNIYETILFTMTVYETKVFIFILPYIYRLFEAETNIMTYLDAQLCMTIDLLE